MRFLSLTLPTVEENLACDEALLLEAEAGTAGECLRLWEWPFRAVILGAAGIVRDDVREEACEEDDITLGRRSSGGGTVLLGSGCLLYSLVLSYDRAEELKNINSSYRYILGKIRETLRPAIAGIELAGTSDLAVGGQKFSGNSQQRKRNFLLHHGTILYAFNLESIGKYLHLPRRQPDYRDNRDHQSFLMNLPLHKDMIADQLRNIWQATEETLEWPKPRVKKLVQQKYAKEEWIRRR